MSTLPAFHLSLRGRSSRRGVALVIVLAFIVLLSGLLLAFFSRAMNDRQISAGSASESKSELFAQGALDTIVGDLKQEMVAGAASPAPSPIPAGVTLCLPKAVTAIPFRVGTNANLPGLLKRSASAQAFYSASNYDTTHYPAIPGQTNQYRASNVSSITPSVNGRSVTPARWNAHYLLPKKTLTSDTDATPIADDGSGTVGFVPPDWIYVARDGTDPVKWSTSLADSSATNNSFVTGRYAYAIYDEGGLLDMNVAGHPTGTTAAQTAYRPAVALADLTQIGLTQSQIDQIVGWRNYASTMPMNSFPSFGFGASQATNFYNLVLGNWQAQGFMTAANTSLNGNQSDHGFSSRQALLRLLIQGIAGSGTDSTSVSVRANLQNALQYMGTFSRDLDQPSFYPNPSLPAVQFSSLANTSPYGRGNDAYNTTAAMSDRYISATVKSPYDINPPFASVRVVTPFTRSDGTQALAGDPLLKYRFALSRLGKILYNSTASRSESDPIYHNFGLYRSDPSQPWVYEHSIDGTSGGILRLSYPPGGAVHQGVAQEGREPDFFELLKAAINVGSVGKTFWGSMDTVGTGTYVQDQYSRDISSAFQILQIGANIIDQSDSDGFPTRITFLSNISAGAVVDQSRVVAGVEDLPYIYYMRNRPIIVNATTARLMMQPVLWNPHDAASGATTAGPTLFCVTAKAVQPRETTYFQIQYNHTTSPATQSFPIDWVSTHAYGPITFKAGERAGFYGFRQPTLVAEANIPAGTYSTGNVVTSTLADTSTQSIGIVATQFPLKDPNITTSPFSYAWNTSMTGGPSGAEFDLCYYPNNDPTQTPVPYNSFVAFWDGTSDTANDAGSDGNKFTFSYSSCGTDAAEKSWAAGAFGSTASCKAIDVGVSNATPTSHWWGMSRADPRTNRWSTQTAQYDNFLSQIDVPNNIYGTHRPDTGISLGNHHTRPSDAQVATEMSNYPNAYWERGYQYGYWADNDIRNTNQTDGSSPYRYNYDTDGIVRRAMGGFATDTTVGGSATNTSGLPLVTNNSTSRPMVLNRPFQSVAELGYAYRGEPWKDLSFSTPESGDTALLDVFTLDEVSNTNVTVAGRVDLNTRQIPVLKALLAGTNVETTDSTSVITASEAQELATAFVARTSGQTSGGVPIASRGEVVGTWTNPAVTLSAASHDPDYYFSGFASDIGKTNTTTSQPQDWTGKPQAFIGRQRESVIRALVDAGSARTWNLMIDIVAQSGRFPVNAANAATPLAAFQVEGEKRYWLHISIDRLTGTVLDQKLEAVNE